MPCKNRPLRAACCSSLPFSGCMHGGILRLLSPRGTGPNSFSVNFHPLPNSDEPFLPPTPQWRICPRSLCPPLISFFWLLPLCRRHAAYANTRSFIRGTPPLNECNLKWGHTFHTFTEGHGNMHILQSVDLHARSDTQSLKHLTILKMSRHRTVWLIWLFCLYGSFIQTTWEQKKRIPWS